jgi:glycosyltransferase involved in cell wall biosynthesis
MNTRAVISAIICTHNRLRYLDDSVGSLARQTLTAERFEIILVDNRSTDGTAAWAEKAARVIPNFRYVLEPSLGLNHARNAGWKAANGEIAAFLDDDAVAADNWLEILLGKFRERGERLAAIGGKVDPLWEAPPPPWLTPELWSFLSVLDWADHDIELHPQQFFVGANMAIRTDALKRVGGFHTDLDRKGGNLLSNGEVHLKKTLEALGYYTIYTPDAKVAHSVPAKRMTKSWFRRRHYWQGVSDSVMASIQADPSMNSRNLTARLNRLRSLMAIVGKGVMRLPRWRWQNNVAAELQWHYLLGRDVKDLQG